MTGMTEYNETMNDENLLSAGTQEFARLVNTAFKNYGSLLGLARSPLAFSSLIAPALILEPLHPTSDDRGRALRDVLKWAVNRLAPAPPSYPLGVERPFDDSTWWEPLWWGYNLLRHRYLEPLHPDARENGFTDALQALTGIPDPDRYYEVRRQAITEIAQMLHEQLLRRRSDAEIQRVAVEELYRHLENPRALLALLNLTATFRGVFPREALLELANAEDTRISGALTTAFEQRLLQAGDDATTLWMPPALQAYLHSRQPAAKLRERHRRAVCFYQEQDQPLQTAWHLRLSGDVVTAAKVLLTAADTLIGELQTQELRDELLPFVARQLPTDVWFQVQRLLVDVHCKLGERNAALKTCQVALKAADGDAAKQAQIYRRKGKLHEKYNEREALDYYQRAIERFPETAPELIDTLKDQAWIYIHRQEWARAEANLVSALHSVSPDAWRQHADIHLAFASLYRQQRLYDDALDHAQCALALREEYGDAQLAAEAKSNVALIYAEMGETDSALATYKEILNTFEALKNRPAVATVLLNMGMTLQLAKRLSEAVDYYKQSLTLFEEYGDPLNHSRLCYNLAETYATSGQTELAKKYWEEGRRLSQETGLESELIWYNKLLAEFPFLQSTPQLAQSEGCDVLITIEGLPSAENIALNIARQEGQVTAKRLIEAAKISKATATRKLGSLVTLGFLKKWGDGVATHYTYDHLAQER